MVGKPTSLVSDWLDLEPGLGLSFGLLVKMKGEIHIIQRMVCSRVLRNTKTSTWDLLTIWNSGNSKTTPVEKDSFLIDTLMETVVLFAQRTLKLSASFEMIQEG